MPTPDLPQTEAEVRGWLVGWTEATAFGNPAERHRATLFLHEYDDAVTVLKQDAVTAYATAVRAMERRAKR